LWSSRPLRPNRSFDAVQSKERVWRGKDRLKRVEHNIRRFIACAIPGRRADRDLKPSFIPDKYSSSEIEISDDEPIGHRRAIEIEVRPNLIDATSRVVQPESEIRLSIEHLTVQVENALIGECF